MPLPEAPKGWVTSRLDAIDQHHRGSAFVGEGDVEIAVPHAARTAGTIAPFESQPDGDVGQLIGVEGDRTCVRDRDRGAATGRIGDLQVHVHPAGKNRQASLNKGNSGGTKVQCGGKRGQSRFHHRSN